MNNGKTLKQKIFDIIDLRKEGGKLSVLYSIVVITLIMISCISLFLEIIGVSEGFEEELMMMEYFIMIFFIIEYILKIFTADLKFTNFGKIKSRFEFIITFESLVDLIAIFSILLSSIFPYLTFLPFLKLIKLAKIVEHVRVNKDEDHSYYHMKKRLYNIIMKDTLDNKLSETYDILIIVIVSLSTIMFVISMFTNNIKILSTFNVIDIITSSLLLIDYVARIWLASFGFVKTSEDRARMKYIFSIMGFIDLIAMLPIFSSTFSNEMLIVVFKIFVVLRILKLLRYIVKNDILLKRLSNLKG